MTDEQAMRRAIELALRGTGRVSPNPRVGCVILKEGRVIGEGWHAAYGAPHAEVVALQNATEEARGATMVVTLEPCVHYGKTPPCVPQIIAAGIARVVVGMLDPNPLVAGKGCEQLRQAGVEVRVGVLEPECRWINRFFAKHITTSMPYVVGKIAQSLDGCIALPTGESRWITGEESRRRVHALRAELDAVMVGKNTVFRDNPQLTVRDVPGRQPWRVVLDTGLQLPLMSFVFTDEYRDRTIVCCSPQALQTRKAETFRRSGIQLMAVPIGEDGRLQLPALFRLLSEHFNIASVLVEGGAVLLSSCLRHRLLDELHVFIAPKVFGAGRHPFEQWVVETLEQVWPVHIQAVMRSGNDLHVIALKEPIARSGGVEEQQGEPDQCEQRVSL
ncbi:MAG: bifunctional diaminohydroxyphosphoribosylaminopyrimidine deaminase/5-amino-6-(5-phosphoribosylamino)uracil reductase RibD [Chlorobiota bacterium]